MFLLRLRDLLIGDFDDAGTLNGYEVSGRGVMSAREVPIFFSPLR